MFMRKKYLKLLLLLPVFYCYSYILISNYTNGDQFIYRALYSAFTVTNFQDVMEVSRLYVSAEDILSSYILWIGASIGIDKDIFISIINAGLLLCIYVIAKKYRVKRSMLFLILTNYYLIVLMTGAERLKFSFVFFLIAVVVETRTIKIGSLVAAIFAHLQATILIGSLALGIILGRIKQNFVRSKNYLIAILGSLAVLAVFAAVLYYQKDAINLKFNAYLIDQSSSIEMLQIAIFLFAGLIFINDKKSFSISIMPLALLTTLIGGSRVNMMAVVIGVYWFWREGKANHPFLYGTMLYFSIKTIPFVERIFLYGNGFSES